MSVEKFVLSTRKLDCPKSKKGLFPTKVANFQNITSKWPNTKCNSYKNEPDSCTANFFPQVDYLSQNDSIQSTSDL